MIQKKVQLFALVLLLSSFVSGCLYPADRKSENQVPHPIYVEQTQKAVEQLQEQSGVLPIVTKDASTPYFEKYEVDFTRLVPKYMPDAPANAFEKGGKFKYVLIDVEEKPLVKLINLPTVSLVADVQQAVIRYQISHDKLPIKEHISNGYFSIRYDLIGIKEPVIHSPYTQNTLSLIMNAKGEVGIDYAIDIATLLREKKWNVPKGTDPRYVVARETFFVPVKSFPYKLVNHEPELLQL
ncbi:hypothetical protein J5TS2_09670 [Brevibacillus halotolerans]|uniref:hypothetical protein n=1 Tax=Brevibacillus halotolerans TaxID=1507437 RepID=UPI001B01E4F3|nr:hypothetical protein [Brevibacillus halotolerans]GIO00299.1 hypothetical protein J5TS2_09670 [Brevibacillus halotolerans]